MRDFPGKAIFRTIHTLPLIMAPIYRGIRLEADDHAFNRDHPRITWTNGLAYR